MNISTICWLRRDLRLTDNTALQHALAEARSREGRCLCIFVFDTEILSAVPERADRRVSFLHGSVLALRDELRRHGSDLLVLHGNAEKVASALVRELVPRGLAALHFSHDHEPRRLARDESVAEVCRTEGVRCSSWKDVVVFEKDEVLSRAGTPLKVFTPYRNAWLRRLEEDESFHLADRVADLGALVASRDFDFPEPPSLPALGFEAAEIPQPGEAGALRRFADFAGRMDRYRDRRDLLADEGTSRLGVDLRFGTISIRTLVGEARRQILSHSSEGAKAWLDELVWREFHQMLLHHFPRIEREAFQGRYEAVSWDDPDLDQRARSRWEAWKEARTGYPVVDAAMRQILSTGWMHNRARMVVASFLTKDLHIHWWKGERFFARHLLDYDLAQNVGGWQWSASTGADGQPWFRVFNPSAQGGKFDGDGAYVRRWCPELAGLPDSWIHHPWDAPSGVLGSAGVVLDENWPRPIVDHAVERLEALDRFRRI